MAKIVISKLDRTIDIEDVDIDPYSTDTGVEIYNSVTLLCKHAEATKDLKEKVSYTFNIEGENVDTGKVEVYKFQDYKLMQKDNNKLVFFHPDYCFNYALEMSVSRKESKK